jgi:hypothetical protein
MGIAFRRTLFVREKIKITIVVDNYKSRKQQGSEGS